MEPLSLILIIAFGFGAGSIFVKKPCVENKPAQIIEQKQETKSCKSQK